MLAFGFSSLGAVVVVDMRPGTFSRRTLALKQFPFQYNSSLLSQ